MSMKLGSRPILMQSHRTENDTLSALQAVDQSNLAVERSIGSRLQQSTNDENLANRREIRLWHLQNSINKGLKFELDMLLDFKEIS